MKEVSHHLDRGKGTVESCLSLKGKLASLAGEGTGPSTLEPDCRQSEREMWLRRLRIKSCGWCSPHLRALPQHTHWRGHTWCLKKTLNCSRGDRKMSPTYNACEDSGGKAPLEYRLSRSVSEGTWRTAKQGARENELMWSEWSVELSICLSFILLGIWSPEGLKQESKVLSLGR